MQSYVFYVQNFQENVFSRKYGPAIQSSAGKTKDVISSMLYKSKLPQKCLWPEVNNKRGLSNNQTEIVKNHPASWSPIETAEKRKSVARMPFV